jgi:hypothetical protein
LVGAYKPAMAGGRVLNFRVLRRSNATSPQGMTGPWHSGNQTGEGPVLAPLTAHQGSLEGQPRSTRQRAPKTGRDKRAKPQLPARARAQPAHPHEGEQRRREARRLLAARRLQPSGTERERERCVGDADASTYARPLGRNHPHHVGLFRNHANNNSLTVLTRFLSKNPTYAKRRLQQPDPHPILCPMPQTGHHTEQHTPSLGKLSSPNRAPPSSERWDAQAATSRTSPAPPAQHPCFTG